MKNMKRREFLKTSGVAVVGAGCLAAGVTRLHAQEETNKVTNGAELKPGEKVKASGIYDVLHDKIDGEHHAEQHQVIVIAGTALPHCKGCGEWVRFRLYQEAEYIDRDPRFES